MKSLRFRILLVCFAIQLILPFSMVWRHYDTLKNGEPYKVSVSLRDPYDPFRGRYVTINPSYVDKDTGRTRFRLGTYTKIEKDLSGYALFTSYEDKEEPGLIKNLTINKYYLSQAQAPHAELLIRQDQREGRMYIILCVKNSNYVVEGLYYDDQPIEDYLSSQGVR